METEKRTKFCKYCRQTMPADTVICPSCGRAEVEQRTKFCKHCGQVIPEDAVICTACGRQVEMMNNYAPVQPQIPQIYINNTNTNSNINNNAFVMGRKMCNKWVSFLLCFFLGFLGAHKFYEGKAGMGILYLLTVGLFGFGWIIDIIIILFKPNPYYV